MGGLKPMGGAESHLQNGVKYERQRYYDDARPKRQRKLKAIVNHQNRGGLTYDCKPTEPKQRVETNTSALRQMNLIGGVFKHHAQALFNCIQHAKELRLLLQIGRAHV